MIKPNPGLQPVTLELSSHEVQVLMHALVHFMADVRTSHDGFGNTVQIPDLISKIMTQWLRAPAHPESAT